MAALDNVALARAAAEGNDTTHWFAFARLAAGHYRLRLEIFGFGFGITADSDGCDGVGSTLSNCANTPLEVMDMDFG